MKYSFNASPHMMKYEFLVVCVLYVITHESRISLSHKVKNVLILGTHLVKRVRRFVPWKPEKCSLLEMRYSMKTCFLLTLRQPTNT